MVEAFDHRAKAYVSGRGRSAVWQELQFGTPAKAIVPQWRLAIEKVPAKAETRWKRYRVGFCDVGGVTNARFLMAAMIPPNVLCGHSVPTILFNPQNDCLAMLWLGVANSFCVDFLARKKAALHMTYTVLDSLPLPRTYGETLLEREIARRALMLTATGPEMETIWNRTAPMLGLDPRTARPCEDPARRRSIRTELDVLVARDFFGLTLGEMRYLLDPGDVLGPDCGFETFGALKRAEGRESGGAFTTRDQILEAWRTLRVPVDLASLPDGTWARSGQLQPGDTGAALAAILKAMHGLMPIRSVRLAAALLLEPRLAAPLLPAASAVQWRRLVGTEADPLPGSVATFAARINAAWGAAVRSHRGNGRLVEDLSSGTWAPGPGLETIDTTGWPDGRARYILDLLDSIDLTAAVTALPNEIQSWIVDVAA
jgi:hypothetical protein